MEKQKKNIAGTVRELVSPVADSLGFMLWDVEYLKEGADMILRITIDKPEGIDIEDCEKMARAIDPIIDEADPIEVSYKMEVSSPGIERVLSRPEHFEACMGEKIEVKLYAPVDGKKQIVGILAAADDKTVTVDVDGSETVLEKSAVAKVSTVFDW
ncbi:MAG: ribosome maturation factor RimP [Ruminococcaceae bacterium]|nr:ribosome maturation factor RimP [Oscillospiraceae bacterium]